MDTTVTNIREAYVKYQGGLIGLGELLALLARFLDLTEEEPEPAPPPAPAVAAAKKEPK